MSTEPPRRMRAGDGVEDLCRACKAMRRHTVMVASPEGAILRVVCDYCGSQHHWRGGDTRTRSSPEGEPLGGAGAVAHRSPAPGPAGAGPFPLVSERERSFPPMNDETLPADLELLLRRVIREEAGLTPVPPADRWRGGHFVLRPGRPGLQEKVWPIETFFQKVVMLRNRLRVLEQQINSAEIPDDLKLKLQGYVTGCYGSLTSFNVLFADESDRFVGTGGGSD